MSETRMRESCPICRGSKTIRLPVYREMSVSFADYSIDASAVSESYRTYPCPECADRLDDSKVMILQGRASGRTEYFTDAGFVRHIQKNIAYGLAQEFLENGLIAFSEPKALHDSDPWFGDTEVTGTLGAVSMATVATMEQRIAERQFEMAEKLASAAAEKIRHWDSSHTDDGGPIYKNLAVQYIWDALRKVTRP